MPTDYKGKIIHNMSQTKFNELLESNDGKLPAEFANSIVHTRAEDVNLCQISTEIVYDMTSSDSEKNWGYQDGILGGVTVSGKDFSKYNKLIIHSYNLDNALTLIYDLDYVEPNTQSIAGLSYDNKAVMQLKCSVNSSRTSFTVNDIGYYNTSGYTSRNDSISYFVYKIEGVITKQPAMIYTGAELYEGNGISIENGVISGNYGRLLWTNPEPENGFSAQTKSFDLSQYDLILITFFTRAYSSRGIYDSRVISKNKKFYLLSFDLDGNRKYRSVTATNTGVTFADERATDDCVPYQIYGLKIGV